VPGGAFAQVFGGLIFGGLVQVADYVHSVHPGSQSSTWIEMRGGTQRRDTSARRPRGVNLQDTFRIARGL
jgi:hypothetical protein